MQPYLELIYSLLYAAEHMGLSSLVEFKNLMKALNDPVSIEKYVNPEVLRALTPSPSPEELNVYFCEMSERNDIPLEKINIPGHQFAKDFHGGPSVPPINPNSNFDDLERKLGEDLKNKFGQGGGGFNGGQVGHGRQGGFGGGGTGDNFNPYKYMDAKGLIGSNNAQNIPSNQGPSSNQFGGGGGNNPMGGTGPSNNQFVEGNNPMGGTGSAQGNKGNLGPSFYSPPVVVPKTQAPVRQSITSINEIDYYPEIDDSPVVFNKGEFNDPDFDQICKRLQLGL